MHHHLPGQILQQIHAGRWFIWYGANSATVELVSRKFDAMSPSLYTAKAVRDREGRHLKDEHGRKLWKKIAKPMFQGYGFIRFGFGDEDFAGVLKVSGVLGFVKNPGAASDASRYATLPVAVMDAIRYKESRELGAYELARRTGTDKLAIPFIEGGAARISGGAYHDWIGKMSRLSKSGRVTLLLSMLGGEVRVEVDGSQIMEVA
jgi:transcription antitermination factor NusG